MPSWRSEAQKNFVCVWTLAIFTAGFQRFPHFLQANSGTVHRFRHILSISTFISPIILHSRMRKTKPMAVAAFISQEWEGDLPFVSSAGRIRDSVVGIATGYGLGNRGVGVRVPVGSRIFSTSSRLALGSTQPPIQWVPGPLSPGVKRQGREADHSPPASAEVKKTWLYTSTLPYAFMV
jgi:hypothetical protein